MYLVTVLLQQQDRFGEVAATLDFVYPPLFPQPLVHSLQGQAFSVGVLQSHSALSAWVSLGKWLSLSEPQCLQLSNEHPVSWPGVSSGQNLGPGRREPRRPSSSGVGRKCFSYPESSREEVWGGSITGSGSISSTSRVGKSPGGWAWGTSSTWGWLKLLLAGSGMSSQTQRGSILCHRWRHLVGEAGGWDQVGPVLRWWMPSSTAHRDPREGWAGWFSGCCHSHSCRQKAWSHSAHTRCSG